MKKIMTALLFAGLMGTVSAQSAEIGAHQHEHQQHQKLSVEERAKKNTENLSAIVSLSKDQYEKIYGYHLEFQKQREALGHKKEMTAEEQSKLKELRKALRDQESAVLTADQKKLLKEHREKERAEHKGGQQRNDD